MFGTTSFPAFPVKAPPKSMNCARCGKLVRVNSLRTSEEEPICKNCRCNRCGIPFSTIPCAKCQVIHGAKSEKNPYLCQACFEETGGKVEVRPDEMVSH